VGREGLMVKPSSAFSITANAGTRWRRGTVNGGGGAGGGGNAAGQGFGGGKRNG
jgi:hypothetical protein